MQNKTFLILFLIGLFTANLTGGVGLGISLKNQNQISTKVGKAGEKGQSGPIGPQGLQGPPGKDGTVGPQGNRGERGQNGARGPQGEQGPPGKDGKDGFEGKAGPPGPQGEKGPPGQDGNDGIAGPAGPQGPAGKNGKDGAEGKAGPPGPQGEKGEQGLPGQKGARGKRGPKGNPGPQGTPGIYYVKEFMRIIANISIVDEFYTFVKGENLQSNSLQKEDRSDGIYFFHRVARGNRQWTFYKIPNDLTGLKWLIRHYQIWHSQDIPTDLEKSQIFIKRYKWFQIGNKNYVVFAASDGSNVSNKTEFVNLLKRQQQ